MSNTNTGESAFPLATDGGHFSEGMTLRDYFAAKALQGWLTTYPDNVDCHMVAKTAVAKFSYEMADAMLKAREA
jgi:hypothetical protein